jgi:hypothetical protein
LSGDHEQQLGALGFVHGLNDTDPACVSWETGEEKYGTSV